MSKQDTNPEQLTKQFLTTVNDIDMVEPVTLSAFTEKLQATIAATNLNPFRGQLHVIVRKQKNSVKRNGRWDEKWVGLPTLIIGIDGMRSVAQATGEYRGQEGPFWCDQSGQWQDVWTDQHKPPTAAMVKVWRSQFQAPVSGVALFSEFAPPKTDKPSKFNLWQSKPALMIAKVAESHALRKAFPDHLVGLYGAEEFDQATLPQPASNIPETAPDETRQNVFDLATTIKKHDPNLKQQITNILETNGLIINKKRDDSNPANVNKATEQLNNMLTALDDPESSPAPIENGGTPNDNIIDETI